MCEGRNLRVNVEIKNIVMVVGGAGVALQGEVQIKGETVELVSSSEYVRSCFSKDGGPYEDVKMRANEGLKTFGSMKMLSNVSSVTLL